MPSTFAIWEVRTQGNDNNSGCFDPNPTLSTTLSTGNGTSIYPTVSASNYSFVSNDVNNYLYIKSGTNWNPGWYQINSVSSGSAIINANIGQVVQLNRRLNLITGVGNSEVLTSGSWTVDYSQSNANAFLYNNLYLSSTSQFTAIGASFTPNMIGNTVRITYATSGITTGVYVINSLSGNSANLDRVAGSIGGTGGTGYMGGAIADPSVAFRDFKVNTAGVNYIYVKADGEYNKTEASYQPGGGYVNIHGYSIYRHDSGRPVMNLNARDARYFGSSDGNSTRCRNFYIKTFDNRGASLMTNGNNQVYSTIVNCISEGTPNNSAAGLSYKMCAWTYIDGLFTSANDYVTILNHVPNTVKYGGLVGGVITYNSYFKNSIIFLGNLSTTAPQWNNPGQHGGQVIKNNIFIDGTGGYLLSYENFASFGNHSPSFVYNNIFSNNRGTMFNYGGGYTNFSFFIENNYFHNCIADLGTTSPQNYASSKSINVNNIVIPSDPFRNRNAFDIRFDADVTGGNIPKYESILQNFSPSITRRNKDIGPIQSYSKAIKINMNGGMRG